MQQPRILIVEDDLYMAEVIKERLIKMGYLISGMVTSGEEAIRSVREDAPDLILMDIVLSGEMDGIETASQIHLTFNIPIIYVTVHVDDEFLGRAKLTTPLGYILKPCETETMKAAIEIALYRHNMEDEKAQLEAQNLQLQKAESLGRMAGAIAHHFNNQLGVVIGNLEMVLDELPQDTESVKSLKDAMQAAEKAAEMSGLMLTYLGQTPGKREPLDLSGVCLRSLPILRAVMPGEVVLETDLPSPGPVISANAKQMQQLLTNLITNAWESVGEDGGSIHLGVKTVHLMDIPHLHRFPIGWQPQGDDYACIKVADTGDGIADKDIEKLFDPFFSSKFTGRGMGLSVVLGIVRSYSGVVTVESEQGQGSAFQIFFPVFVEEVPRQPDREVQAPDIKAGGTVLLVEDEEKVRDMAKRMLTRMGFAVLEAKDGVEAVEVFRRHQNEISCVLCDLTMPRMNGWETLTALRKLAPNIPVILASGYDEAHAMAGDHPELPQVFLGKPYMLKGLSEAIGQALANRKQGMTSP